MCMCKNCVLEDFRFGISLVKEETSLKIVAWKWILWKLKKLRKVILMLFDTSEIK